MLKEEVDVERLSKLLKEKYTIVASPEDIVLDNRVIFFSTIRATIVDGYNMKYGNKKRITDAEVQIDFLPKEAMVKSAQMTAQQMKGKAAKLKMATKGAVAIKDKDNVAAITNKQATKSSADAIIVGDKK